MPGKTRKARKGPTESASDFPEGTIKQGNDKQSWVIKKVTGGSQRWMPYNSTELFGYKPLTVDYLAKHIGRTITVYEREYKDIWPKNFSKGTSYIHKFTPTGNALLGKNVLEGWLKTQYPQIKNNTMFFIECGEDCQPLQVDSKNKTLVSSNLLNMEAFVKV